CNGSDCPLVFRHERTPPLHRLPRRGEELHPFRPGPRPRPTMRTVRLAFAVLLAVLGYELVRWSVLRTVRERLHRRARRFAQRHGVRVDLFKFGGKLLVREELLNDMVVQRAMLAAAHSGEPAEEVRRRVESYIDEIVP